MWNAYRGYLECAVSTSLHESEYFEERANIRTVRAPKRLISQQGREPSDSICASGRICVLVDGLDIQSGDDVLRPTSLSRSSVHDDARLTQSASSVKAGLYGGAKSSLPLAITLLRVPCKDV